MSPAQPCCGLKVENYVGQRDTVVLLRRSTKCMQDGCNSVRHKECYYSQKGLGYENTYSCVSALADAHRFRNAPMPFLAAFLLWRRGVERRSWIAFSSVTSSQKP